MLDKVRAAIRERAAGDDGIAMILVMGSIVTLTLLMAATMTYALNSQTQARNNQDWHSALNAAQAGVDDFAARLNADPGYWQKPDCSNIAMQQQMPTDPGNCGWDDAGTPVGWQAVNGADGGHYHYELDTTSTYTGGGMRLIATGRSRSEVRTLQVAIRKPNSTQFVYYTDFESADPANRQVSKYRNGTVAQCGANGTSQARYIWSSPGRSQSTCQEIQFASEDVLDGKVHFNDTPMISTGATFLKGFETADPSCKSGTRGNNWSGCSRTTSGSYSGRPNIPSGEAAVYADVLNLPDNSDELLTREGCHYTGDTRIRFYDNGTMRVWSKGTVGQSIEPGCGSPTAAGLGSEAGELLSIPDDKIVYAKNSTSGTGECAPGQIGDGLPVEGDVNFVGAHNSTFFCGNGNLYVEGTIKGRLGIAAQNNVIVTGDILIAGVAPGATPTGTSMVGLVASNSVVVYHPYIKTVTPEVCEPDYWVPGQWVRERYRGGWRDVWVPGHWEDGDCTPETVSYDEGLPAANRYIYASIQTLQRSFWVQSYDEGTKRGDLVVFGSIAQRWRGIVGTSGSGGTGYIKDYRYDQRLSSVPMPPPGIIDFTNGNWKPTVTGEVAPAYGCSRTGGNANTVTCAPA